MSTPAGPGLPSRIPLRIAAALLGLEAAVLIYAEVRVITTGRGLSGVGGVWLAYAVVLAAAAVGVFRGRRWSRGLAIATQLVQIPVAYTLGGGSVVAVIVVVMSVTVIVLLLLRPSTAIFTAENPRG